MVAASRNQEFTLRQGFNAFCHNLTAQSVRDIQDGIDDSLVFFGSWKTFKKDLSIFKAPSA